MNKLIASLFFISIIFHSCEEVPPYIDNTVRPDIIKESFVAGSVPQAQHKAVLIEDITGVRCINCPKAAKTIMDIIADKSEDSVIAMALYINQQPNSTTPYSGFPLLNSVYASEMVDYLGIPLGLPACYIDRSVFGSSSERPLLLNGQWANHVNSHLGSTSPVNISLDGRLNGNKLNAEIELVYTSTVNSEHKVALYLLEDSIMSKQYGGTPTEETYIHNHAMRYSFGASMGVNLYGSLEPGRTFKGNVSYELPSEYKKDQLSLVCVVTDATTYEVINVRKVHIH